MKPVFECRGDTEVAAAAAEAPEQIGVLGRACSEQPAVRGDDVRREKVVARQPVLAAQLAEAAAERQSADAGIAVDTHCRGKAKRLGRRVELAENEACFGAGGAPLRVDLNAFHAGQIDHQPALAHGAAGDVVAAAAHGDQQAVVASKVDGFDDVASSGTADDDRGLLVHHPVPDPARLVIAAVSRQDELTAQPLPKRSTAAASSKASVPVSE